MTKCNLTATVKYRWYVRCIYLPSLLLLGEICDHLGIELNPDWELIGKTIAKGVVIEFKNTRVK